MKKITNIIKLKNDSNKLKIKKVSIIFLISLIIFSGYSMAKYAGSIRIKGSAQIAEPILVVENDPTINITETNPEGEYIFKVKNYNKLGKVTDVDLKYYIEILPNSSGIINIELYQNDRKIELNDNKTEYIEISKDKKEEREYKVKLTFNKDTEVKNDVVDKIQIRVHTEQEKA